MWYQQLYARSALCFRSPWSGSLRCCALGHATGERLVSISETRLDELLQAEVRYLASEQVRTVSMREVLINSRDARRAAKFIHADNPKRIALQIRMIENLHSWRCTLELVEIHERMSSWYRSLRLVERGPKVGLADFTSCCKLMREEGQDMVLRIAVAMHKYKQTAGDEYDDVFFNNWMDGFFLSRIGSNMLMDQYLACLPQSEGGKGRRTGIIDPKCDAVQNCKGAARMVTELCVAHVGKAPPVVVEAYKEDVHGVVDSPIHLSFIPSYLRYIMMELLKNSFAATIKHALNEVDLQDRPVHILVSCDNRRIVIRISDRAGGIPSQVGDCIWSYLHGAAAQSGQHANSLAGYGVGLPLARLFARYLGGNLEIRSFPGFGTDAYLLLPRINAEQVEHIPSS